jgi:hypothetical protein
MALFTQHSFAAAGVRSLCWRGDELVDWVSGGRAFALDGTEKRASINYAYSFDAATASPDGHFAVIYERQGTKGLVLRDGKILRELNRSFYRANVYEYPVALFHEPGGRLLLAHCSKYCRLELEEAETGQALTASDERKPADFFHSRLTASPRGKHISSAGWIWHPWSSVVYFDVVQALLDPRHLDRGDAVRGKADVCAAEDDAVCWLDDDRVALSASNEPEDEEESSELGDTMRLLPHGVAVYDIGSRRCMCAFQLDEPAGTLFAIGPNHVLSLYRHPKLIDLVAGTVSHVWTELRSGRQTSSIIWGLKDDAKPPPMAFDQTGKRFAIANEGSVTVIAFDRSALDGQ